MSGPTQDLSFSISSRPPIPTPTRQQTANKQRNKDTAGTSEGGHLQPRILVQALRSIKSWLILFAFKASVKMDSHD